MLVRGLLVFKIKYSILIKYLCGIVLVDMTVLTEYLTDNNTD